jgi:hypothetical protein
MCTDPTSLGADATTAGDEQGPHDLGANNFQGWPICLSGPPSRDIGGDRAVGGAGNRRTCASHRIVSTRGAGPSTLARRRRGCGARRHAAQPSDSGTSTEQGARRGRLRPVRCSRDPRRLLSGPPNFNPVPVSPTAARSPHRRAIACAAATARRAARPRAPPGGAWCPAR